METEKLLNQRERLLGKLATADPGSEQYAALLSDIKQIDDMLIKLQQADHAKTEHFSKLEIDEENLKIEKKKAEDEATAAKRESWLKFAGTVAGGLIAGVFALIGIRETVDIEEDDIPSRNGYGIASRLFPRGK